MGLGLVPIFLGKRPAAFKALGEVLAQELDALEQIAADRGLTPLSTFSDQRQVPDDFDGAPEDLDDLIGPCTDWFDPAIGAAAVARLIDVLRAPSVAANGLAERDAVIEELTALKACLEKARHTDTKFRLTLA